MDQGLLARIAAARNLVVAACGSTALGLAAAAADLPRAAVSLLRDPPGEAVADSPWLRGLGGDALFLGLSISGASAEVAAALRAAARGGMRAVYASAAPQLGEGSDGLEALRLEFDGVPRRYLPLAACLLLHRLRGSGFGPELDLALESAADAPAPALSGALESAYRGGLLPVFIAQAGSDRALMLAAQYMEFLKRPAFHLSFPGWTHDFLWALGPAEAGRVAVIHLGPARDLADGRFAKARDRLESLGIAQLSIGDYPEAPGPARESRAFARTLLLYRELASRLGLESDRDGNFE